MGNAHFHRTTRKMSCMQIIVIAAAVAAFALCVHPLFAQSFSPRQTGEEILLDLQAMPDSLTIRVASNGCTSRNSFRIDIRKEEGISPKVPHYVLTIYRIQPDECKMMVYGGEHITFDLAKDLGLKGMFTYSVTNGVYSGAAGSVF